MIKKVLLGLLVGMQVSAGILDIMQEQDAARDLIERVNQKAQESTQIREIYDQKQAALSGVHTSIDTATDQIEDIKSRIGAQIDELETQIQDYTSTLQILAQREKGEFEKMILPLKRELDAIQASAPYQEKVGELVRDLREYNRSWKEQKSRYRGLWDGIDSLDVGLRIGAKEEAINKAVQEFTGDVEARIKEHEDHFKNTRKVYYGIIQRSIWTKIRGLEDQKFSLGTQIFEQTQSLRGAITQMKKDAWAISKPFSEEITQGRKDSEIHQLEGVA